MRARGSADTPQVYHENGRSDPSSKKRRGFKVNRYHMVFVFLAVVVLLIVGITLQTVPDVEHPGAHDMEPRRASAPADSGQLPHPHEAASPRLEGLKQESAATAPNASQEPPMTVGITGLSKVEYNGKYNLNALQVVVGRETFWSGDGEFFLYYCKNSDVPDLLERWCLARSSNFDLISSGECRAVARAVKSSPDPHINGGWEEYPKTNSNFLAAKQLEMASTKGAMQVVTLSGFLQPDHNSEFLERRDLKVNLHETYWSLTGELFIYWCSVGEMKEFVSRWVVAPARNYVQIEQGECSGMVRAPIDRDILDQNMPKGWEEKHEEESWLSFKGGSGVSNLTRREELQTSLDNRQHAHHADHHHSQHGQVHACVRCGAKIHGPLPTSLIAHTYHHCSWKFQPRKRLEDAVDESKYDVHIAKSLCIDLGVDCTGVTCLGGDHSCSLRNADELTPTRDDFEWTYVKACPPKLETGCEDLGSRPEERGLDPELADNREMSDATIVVLGGNRLDYLKACLTSLSFLIDISMVRIFVSLSIDAIPDDADVIINEVESTSGLQIQRWQVPPRYNFINQAWRDTPEEKLAHHYNATFEKIFMEDQVEYALFVDEGLIFSPDFLSLFRSTAWLLKRDPSLWCISAWNENAFRVSDACRLMRTSSFPGNGFLMRKNIWPYIRSSFPPVIERGWESQMKLAFKSNAKECVIPEVPRVHRPNRNSSKDVRATSQDLMEYATVPTTCLASGDCAHFGNTTYLMDKSYEKILHTLIRSHPRVRFNSAGLIEGAERLDSSTVHILPFVKQDYTHNLAVSLGHRPASDEFKALPQELHADHYGMVYGRLSNLAQIILVDMRSTRKHLLLNERTSLSAYHKPFASKIGESCTEACERAKGRCDWTQIEYFNSCRYLEETFKNCKNRCVVGDDSVLPALVMNESSIQNAQCLVTLSALVPGQNSCSLKSPDKARLCACGMQETTTSFKKVFHEWEMLFTTVWDPYVLARRPLADTRKFATYGGVFDGSKSNHVPRIGVNADDQMWEYGKVSNKAYSTQESGLKADREKVFYDHNHNPKYNPRQFDFVKVKGVYLEHFPRENGNEDVEVRDLDASYIECERLDNPRTASDTPQGSNWPLNMDTGKLHTCTGITCDHNMVECTCRSGQSIKKSFTGEVTFVHKDDWWMGKRMPSMAMFRKSE